MRKLAIISPLALAVAGAVSGCEMQAPTGDEVSRAAPIYGGVETHLLADDLVNFHVVLQGAEDGEYVRRYAECAAAQYTLIRGYGFARHVRTNVVENNGLWQADAVYTISAWLPRGLKTIDAEVVAADCAENGIPMV